MRQLSVFSLFFAVCVVACDSAPMSLGDSGSDASVDRPLDRPDSRFTSCEEALRFGQAGDACEDNNSFPCDQCRNGTLRSAICFGGELRFENGASCSLVDGGHDDGGHDDAGPNDGGPNDGGPGDVGPNPTDGGPTDGGPNDASPDASPGDGGMSDAGMCPPRVQPVPASPGCYAGTRACIVLSETADQINACISADPNPVDCEGCNIDAVDACATSMGLCDDENGAVTCCLDAACGPGPSTCRTNAAAPGGSCRAQVDIFLDCRVASVSSNACPYPQGVCFPAPVMCGPVIYPPPAARSCASSTRTCLQTGGTLETCVAADPNSAACDQCITNDIFFCITRNGCADEFGQRGCCLNTACPTGDAGCRQTAIMAGGACAAQQATWSACFDVAVNSCGLSALTNCFPG